MYYFIEWVRNEIHTIFFHIFLTTSSFSQNPFWQHLVNTEFNTITAINFNQQGYIFASFTPGQIHRSTDNGTSWTKMWDSTMNTIVYSIVVDSNDYIFASTSTRTPGPFGLNVGKLIYSTDNGLSWMTSDSGLGSIILNTLSINVTGNSFFGGSSNGAIYRSTNNGFGWVQVRNGIIGDNIATLAFDSNKTF